MSLPVYATPLQRAWYYGFRVICGLIFFFLIAPILVIIPLSFNAQDFFTFTKEMLNFDPAGYSLKHYEDFFTNSDWQIAVRNSFKIAPAATLLSVAFGTLAAIGLSQPHVPFRRVIMAILISPMIVPLIISAAGMYFFYSRGAGACGAWHPLCHHHRDGDIGRLRQITCSRLGQSWRRTDDHLLPYPDALDPAGGCFGWIVRLYHVL